MHAIRSYVELKVRFKLGGKFPGCQSKKGNTICYMMMMFIMAVNMYSGPCARHYSRSFKILYLI